MKTLHDLRTAATAPPARTVPRLPIHDRGVAVCAGALGVVWAGLAVVVAVDGSWPWRAARVVAATAVVGAAVAAVVGGSRRVASLVSAAVGLVALPAGATIGVPHLVRTGWSLRAGGGLVAAGAGGVLLVVGAVRVLRSVPGWRRVAVAPLGLVLAYFVASPVMMSLYATNVPRPALGPETPSDRGLEYRDVAFATSDGVRLSGWYIPSTNRAAVVLLHGASSTRSNVLDQAVVLARHGYGVLLYDARGVGLSGGRAMNMGWYGDRDVAAAVSYLAGRPEVDPERIAAVGESMGGEQAIGAMAADRRIRAVVAEGATSRVAGDQAWLSDRYGVRGQVQEAVNGLTYALTDLLTAARPPATLRASAAAAAPRPVLLVAAGTVDEEAYAAAFIHAAAPGSVDVWVVPGATHTSGVRTAPAAWEERVTAFLDGALGGRR